MRVLHVTGGLGQGGTETWFVQVLPKLIDAGYSVDVLVFSDGEEAYTSLVESYGSRVIVVPYNRKLMALHRELVGSIVRHGPYDVVHSHVWLMSGLVMRAAHLAGVKTRVVHSRNASKGRGEKLARVVYRLFMRRLISRYATDLVAITDDAGRALFGHSRWANRGRVIPTAIDLSPFAVEHDRCRVRRELGLRTGSFVVGHVGRFSAPKNHAMVLRVFQALLQVVNDAQLLLVGDGRFREEIRSFVKTNRLQDNVVFAGPRNDVPRLMSAAIDVFLFPSHSEGLGRVVVEAQAAGVPCLISSVIPGDADVVPGLVRRLSLDEPPTTWAREIVTMSQTGLKHDRMDALRTVERSYMNLNRSIDLLDDLYRGRK